MLRLAYFLSFCGCMMFFAGAFGAEKDIVLSMVLAVVLLFAGVIAQVASK